MSLDYPFVLIGLVLIPLWIFLEQRGIRRYTIYGTAPSTKYQKNFYLSLFSRWVIGSLLIASAIITIAKPVQQERIENPLKNGIDIAIVLDISRSMLAEDVLPNRINKAKEVLTSFVHNRSFDRISLIIFAGKPFLFSPLSFDQKWLLQVLSRIWTESIRQELPGLSGTNIWDALLLAIDSLKENENAAGKNREKIILLITDWEANIGTDPKLVALKAKEEKISIYSIGIGSENGTELIITGNDGIKRPLIDASTGKPIISRVDGELLSFLANTTNGKTLNAQNAEILKQALETIDSLKKTELADYAEFIELPLVGWMLCFTAFLWSIFLFLERRKFDSPFL